MRGSTCAAMCIGRCSTTMSGRSGIRPRSASWRWTGRPLPASQDRAPHGWARSRTLVSSPFKGSWHKAPEGLPPNPCHPCDDRFATVIRPPVESNSGLAAVLRGVVADFQHVSGAEIVSIFLYDDAAHTYYAPFAAGQPQESLLDSLTDMHEQLARYLADEKQGKVPDDLGVHQYGSTVWLTVTRRRLVARNAPAEIDSTFIRRYQVQSTIGLPLLSGDRLLGLIYLNYRNKEHAPDDSRLKELERRAGTAAGLIQAALEGAERAALDGLSRLASLPTAPVGAAPTNANELRRLLSIALADLLMASNLDGAAIYQFGHQRSDLELVTAHLRVAAPAQIQRGDSSAPWDSVLAKAIGDATAEADLHAVATYALGQPDDPHG